MDKNEKKKENKPEQPNEQVLQQLRMTFLATKGINALREEIIKNANEQIDALNAEQKKITDLNKKAAEDLEKYKKTQETKQ